MSARLDVARDGHPALVAAAAPTPQPLAPGVPDSDDRGRCRAVSLTARAAVTPAQRSAGGGRRAAAVPTPGPWVVRGEAEPGAPPAEAMLGVEPAGDDGSGGWPYLVRRDAPVEPGGCPLHIATGIQRLADARLIAAAPDLAAALLALLVAPAVSSRGIYDRTRAAVDAAWTLLVRVVPHLDSGS